MNPEQQHRQPTPQPQSTPPQQPYMAAPPVTPAPELAHKESIKLPVILMVWPGATLVLMLLLGVVAGMISGSGDISPIRTALNVILFLGSGIAVLLGPISFIIGLVLLIVRKTRN